MFTSQAQKSSYRRFQYIKSLIIGKISKTEAYNNFSQWPQQQQQMCETVKLHDRENTDIPQGLEKEEKNRTSVLND